MALEYELETIKWDIGIAEVRRNEMLLNNQLNIFKEIPRKPLAFRCILYIIETKECIIYINSHINYNLNYEIPYKV